jgi:DNA-binding transcriptional LysR family regulator
MRTTLDQWAVLAAVIDEGGFRHAASKLHRSQSAVSYAVSQLQESLGVALLQIEGRKAVLTAVGATLLQRARTLLDDAKTLEQLASSVARGWEAELQLVVDAAFPRPRLLEIISELQKSCPDTRIQWSDVVLSGAEEAITAGQADLVVSSRVPSGYLGDRLLEVEFIAVARPDHALFRYERPLNEEDLKGFVQAVVRDSGTDQPRDEGWLGAPRRFTVSSMEASLATLLAGLGFAWLPAHLLEQHLRSGALRRLPLSSGASRHVSLYLVLTHPQTIGPAVRAAIDAFKR